MKTIDYIGLFLITLTIAGICLLFTISIPVDSRAKYPYTEHAQVPIGSDTVNLVALYLNDTCEVNIMQLNSRNEYIYIGSYENIEMIIDKIKESNY
jgi:hypothetical protein|tara:strand:- start:4346 stop:4633 length:288 start_codon:yes stop_codon:yes gene_type:complete